LAAAKSIFLAPSGPIELYSRPSTRKLPLFYRRCSEKAESDESLM